MLCRRPGVADVFGYHSVTCGNKYAIHNTLRDVVKNLFGDALMEPKLEPHAFPDAPGRRGDVIITLRGRNTHQRIVVDVSVVSPFAVANFGRAIAQPGGAASKAAEDKIRSYGSLPEGGGVELVPVCADSLGAFNEAGFALLKKAAATWGKRFDVHPSRAIPLTLSVISTVLASEIGKLVVANSGSSTLHDGMPVAGNAPSLDDFPLETQPMENPRTNGQPLSLQNRFAERWHESTRLVQQELARELFFPPLYPAVVADVAAGDDLASTAVVA
jgi:hypothetical protein